MLMPFRLMVPPESTVRAELLLNPVVASILLGTAFGKFGAAMDQQQEVLAGISDVASTRSKAMRMPRLTHGRTAAS